MLTPFKTPLHVKIVEYRPKNYSGPTPFPTHHGFRVEVLYEVLAVLDYSETGEMYFVLANDDGEIWSIPTRHLRVFPSVFVKGVQNTGIGAVK